MTTMTLWDHSTTQTPLHLAALARLTAYFAMVAGIGIMLGAFVAHDAGQPSSPVLPAGEWHGNSALSRPLP